MFGNIVQLLLVFSSVEAQICFEGQPCSQPPTLLPSKTRLPDVEPCPGDETFCGNDLNKYPLQKVKNVLHSNLQISPRTTKAKFFAPSTPISHPGLNPACSSRTQFIPRYGRAKNLEGKWRYLVQGGSNEIQHQQVTICNSPEAPCKTDEDSPHGPGTTICKQIFRTEKLLATDEEGELHVDSFSLPSACVCHYVDTSPDFGLRSNFPKHLESCEMKETKLEKVLLQLRSSRWGSGSSALARPKKAAACGQNAPVCSDGIDYPVRSVESILSNHRLLSNSKVFDTIYGPTCRKAETEINVISANRISLKNGFGLDLSEEPVCNARERYIFPERAKNLKSEWRYVVNVPNFRQGVTIIECGPATTQGAPYYFANPSTVM